MLQIKGTKIEKKIVRALHKKDWPIIFSSLYSLSFQRGLNTQSFVRFSAQLFEKPFDELSKLSIQKELKWRWNFYYTTKWHWWFLFRCSYKRWSSYPNKIDNAKWWLSVTFVWYRERTALSHKHSILETAWLCSFSIHSCIQHPVLHSQMQVATCLINSLAKQFNIQLSANLKYDALILLDYINSCNLIIWVHFGFTSIQWYLAF